MAAGDDLYSQRFYHGTKASLSAGDLIGPGYRSNYGKRKNATYVYLTATLNAAIWGAELALGDGPGRIRVTGEVEEWTPHTPEELKVMHDHLERLRQLGIEAIED